MATHPKVLGLTLDPKLTYSTHIHNISVQSHKPRQIIKALTATGWGKQKETLMATYKAVMRPALEYASSVWSPIAPSTSINKLQVMQNAALRTATGCTQDTNIQHLHDETLTLPIHEHLQLHASQYKQKTQHPSHPLHKHTTYFNTPRLKKPTIFNNGRYTTNIPTDPHTVTTTDIKTNMRHIHTSIVSRHLATRGNTKILRTPPPHTSSSENVNEMNEADESPEEAHFRKHIFYVVLDNVIGGLTVRFSAAKQISDTFSFLWNYQKMSEEELKGKNS